MLNKFILINNNILKTVSKIFAKHSLICRENITPSTSLMKLVGQVKLLLCLTSLRKSQSLRKRLENLTMVLACNERIPPKFCIY